MWDTGPRGGNLIGQYLRIQGKDLEGFWEEGSVEIRISGHFSQAPLDRSKVVFILHKSLILFSDALITCSPFPPFTVYPS